MRMIFKFWLACFLVGLLAAAGSSWAETINYTYDTMNRLTGVQYDDGTTIQYTYDKMGNRLSQTVVTPLLSSGAAEREDLEQTLEEPPSQVSPLPLRALPDPAPLQ